MKKKIFIILLIISLCIFTIIFINIYIIVSSSNFIFPSSVDLPTADAVLVLGATVYTSGKLSDILEDRILKAIEVYQTGKAKKFILSGDHGQREYDEVNSMKDYLLEKGIPKSDIFLDHAGFETYDSIYRAKSIFGAKSLIITTQEYHLYRAVFIANKLDLDVYGVKSNTRKYIKMRRFQLRENFARIKAFIKVMYKPTPEYLGDKIPLTGDSSKSWDQDL